MKRASIIVAAAMCLLSACTKEPSTGLELVAEGMGNGTKMCVDGLASYWQTGDKANINGSESSITVSGGRAYVDGEFSDDNYYIVFPSSIYHSRTGDVVTVNMPATYQYNVERNPIDYSWDQVLNAPLAYYGNASDGKATMRHLTGALNVQITGPSNIEIDKIIVTTTQKRVMSGEMQFDLSDIDGIGSNATNSTANNSVEMRFDNFSFSRGTVQIPIPVMTGNVNFIVRVEGHVEGTKHVFERTQTTGGHLGRGELATVSVNMNSGQEGVTTSALFPTITVGGKTYYQISTPKDLQLMSTAVYGTEYREDGDDYIRDWEYNGLKYKNANYYVMNNIDMSGCIFSTIDCFGGEFNGGNNVISNLTVSGTHDTDYPVNWGIFSYCIVGSTVVIKDVTFSNLTIRTRNSIDYPSYCGSVVGMSSANLTIDNVTVTGFREIKLDGDNTSNHKEYCLGGFVGRLHGDVTVTNSSVDFAADQEFTHKSGGMVNIGGIVGQIYSGDASITLNNVEVDFGTMNYDVGNATRKFGGLITNTYYDNIVTAVSTTLTGDITFSSGSNTANKISPNNGTMSGVNVSGLTIN